MAVSDVVPAPGSEPAKPEPPDPVSAALRMRASDADRERVAGVLRDAYADGRLSLDEHEQRLAEAYRAQTYADLVPVLHDLPVPQGTVSVPVTFGVEVPRAAVQRRNDSSAITIDPSRSSVAERNAVAVFGGFERRGGWVVPDEMNATCIFGGGILDLSDAVLTSYETVITAVCLFGGLEIVVPDGMAVRNEGVAVFGGHSVPESTPPPGAPTLVVKGAAIFGGVDIHLPKGKRGRSGRAGHGQIASD